MKKFLSSALIALVVAFSANICAANDYDYDPNYVFVTTVQGPIYLSIRSIDVQEYNPPHYQIAGTFVHLWGGDYAWEENWFAVAIRYNWYTKETFGRDKIGYWRKDKIEPDCTVTITNRKFADALFRTAYGMDFYGY